MEGNHNSGAKDRSQKDKIGERIRYLLRRYGPPASIVLVFGASVFALWPEPGVKCETTGVGQDLILGEVPGLNESRFFVDNQVIVTGPAFEVEGVVDSYNQDNQASDGNLGLIRECDLHYLSRETRWALFPHVESLLGRQTTTRLYHIPDGRSEKDVVDAINGAGGGVVSADYNLLVGSSQGVCGNPHSSEGSPFGGAPTLLEDHTVAAELFWEQWAFQHVGVGPFLPVTSTTVMHQGEGVVVGVFDTSPFDNEGDGWETVEWVNPAMYTETLTMTMRVSYPEVVNTIEFSPSSQSAVADTEALDDVRDHGLFVAGLVHAVAPASEIRLIRVLNEDGCGDLFLLNEALAQFTNEVEDEATGGVVINLSLGVHDPEEDFVPVACSPEDPDNLEGSENEIESLCTTLSSAYSGGAVIVAAAGNRPYSETVAGGGSGNNYVPQPAQIPAAYDFVIGVRASNVISEAACFSNEGDLLAPGGEGDINNGCTSNVDGCSGNCEFAVIGPVLFPPQGAAYWPTRYAYWSGTSFSAPLVSGLAALLLETRTSQPCVDCGEGASPQTVDWVTGKINCGTSNGSNGVINVPHTLIDCLP